ncbi:MAG: DEAD/DEAH box helicase family protein [Fimbriimonadaceae bacterium]|nr:DEAD/DEAH box helicase family protein [Fimbriimonadaceae bacterium]QYK57861.1 MAG: DEAD/DEAH box helicase family protein [Fimbriimonadaceae bacterium]
MDDFSTRTNLGQPAPTHIKTLIDNRPGNTMLGAVRNLCKLCQRLDVATGYFEVGAFADLHGHWQGLDGIRLLMGDEVTRQTRAQIAQALGERKRNGVERIQEADDWEALDALQAFRKGLVEGTIQAKVYTQAKFHAKALRFHRPGDVVSHAIVGSSNFTHPGLTQNIELNMFTSDPTHIAELDTWYETAWAEAEDLKEDLLQIIEPYVHEYHPFEIYLRAMRERFYGLEPDQASWEMTESKVFPHLAGYQRDAYFDLRFMAERWGGGLLCDGVGLGKTFVALALIERALSQRKRVIVVAPKAAIPSVWHQNLARFFPHDFDPDPNYQHDLRVYPHTDFGRLGGINDERINWLRERYDVVVVDEAHHFRTPHRNRSQRLKQLVKDKELYLLTATPINNSLDDLYHLLNLIAQDRQNHFQSVNVPNLRNWFRKQSSQLEDEQLTLDLAANAELDQFLCNVVVQRSRRYVKSLEAQEHDRVKFPQRERPEVINYSLHEVYGDLLEELFQAFHPINPRLHLVIYQTELYKEDGQDKAVLQEQTNVVSLIRTMFLKRLESSEKALECSIESLLWKHVQVLKDLHELKFAAWEAEHSQVYRTMKKHREQLSGGEESDEEEDDLPLTTFERKAIEQVRQDFRLFGRNEITWLDLLLSDADVLAKLLGHLYEAINPQDDAKLQAFIRKIKETPRLSEKKFVVFSEFKDTARYLEEQLKTAFPGDNIVEVDSGRHVQDRDRIIKRFAPYYNCVNDQELRAALADPIRVLISTDVLSEGLNLQDANVIVNYDLHWNPVRLMQRIGRVDRRMDPSKPVEYDKVYVYNFLPPDDLERLLGLYRNITGKLVQINRALGIEAPILDPDDEFEAQDFYLNAGQGTQSLAETLRLEAHSLAKEHPELWARCETFPNRVFSGKAGEGKKMFLCYRIPTGEHGEGEDAETVWDVRWYLYDSATGKTTEALDVVFPAVACAEGTERAVTMPRGDRTRIRKLVESQEVEAVVFKSQLPHDKRPELVCWMEV